MSVYQELLDYNKIFDQLTKTPKIVNDLLNSNDDERERLKKEIYTYYESDTMSTVPHCECMKVTGEYNVGVFCPDCLTVCEAECDKTLESLLWMRAPHGVEKLINPTIWHLINNGFKISGFEVVRYIADPSYKPQCKTPKAIANLLTKIPHRGYNFFVQNFDEIMDAVFSLKINKKYKQKQDDLATLIKENRHAIFSQYLPIPNKSILIVEGTNAAMYVDPLVVGAINAIQTITSVDSITPQSANKTQTQTTIGEVIEKQLRSTDDLNQRSKEGRAIKAIHGLANFYADYYGSSLAKKPGLFRRQVFGTRSHFSFRAVISSITRPHDKEEIEIPWSVATGVFRLHILNKLNRRGYTTHQAISLLNMSVQTYSPVMAEIFDELIHEAPDAGIPCVLIRNPSLYTQ